ncbi:MAG TPA: aspartate carbamoyltransferase catalytic subunit [Myxococcaceae bacterium]|nr:aspartate carbamoyltransferase catalytic subunit [Myxococcaceae bacterium]
MASKLPGLLAIEGMTKAQVEGLLDRAAQLGEPPLEAGGGPRPLEGRVVANLFFEDSTRTRSSFEIAAKRLGAEVLNWTTKGSSVSKGETLLDTVRNIDAMGPQVIVMRHASSGAAALAARHTRAAVVNAGDGTHEHPSQALLDAFTLRRHLGALEGKRVLIVGDILHSRVARSNLRCLTLLGAKVALCGPPTLVPKEMADLGAELSFDLDEAMEGADAVMMLRVQLERQVDAMFPSPREYGRRWGLTRERADRLPEKVKVLHPGPMNRNVEIATQVADGPRSLILEQVHHGVAVRMAILEACA